MKGDIVKFYIYSHEKGYVVWKDLKEQVGTTFDNTKDLKFEGNFLKIREFERSEILKSLKSYRLQAPDAKIRVITFQVQTIEDWEVDDYR